MSIYYRITEWTTRWCYNCTERYAECPECGGDLCVFCMDICECCWEPVF